MNSFVSTSTKKKWTGKGSLKTSAWFLAKFDLERSRREEHLGDNFWSVVYREIIFFLRLSLVTYFWHFLNHIETFSFSLYDDYHLPLLASPEVDKWPEATLPDFSCGQDFLVPELLQMENLSDDVQPQEELLSLLEEVITEDEKKNKGRQYSPSKCAWSFSLFSRERCQSLYNGA